MSYRGRLFWFVTACIVGTCLILVSLAARKLGLGVRADFVFFRWFGLSRGNILTAGLTLIAVAIFLYARVDRRIAHWMGLTPDALPEAISALAAALTRSTGTIGIGCLRVRDVTRRHAISLWSGARSVSDGIGRYYRPAAPPIRHAWPPYDRAAILLLAVMLQLIYLAAIPLGFECDAATYYRYAEALVGAGGRLSIYRPPAFPVLLIATGTVWPGTFIILLAVQAMMGVAIPLMIYSILYRLGRLPALAGATLIIASAIPFVGAKLVLAEHLYMFLTVLAVYFLARYIDYADPRSIYLFLLAGLAAMLSRWEAMFVVGFGFGAVILLAFRRPQHLRHAILGILLVAGVLATYSTGRALLLRDTHLIGTLQSGSGMQLFQRLYGMQPRYSIRVSPKDREAQPIQLINAENGPATRRLRDLVAEYVHREPASYRDRKRGLANLWGEEPGSNAAYDELFGRFDGNAEALADNIFQATADRRTVQYPFFVDDVAREVLGVSNGDRLLLLASLEAIRTHPDALLTMYLDGFTLTGFHLGAAITSLQTNPSELLNLRRLFPIWSEFGYARVDFNPGGCATGSLPPRMMAEYHFDDTLTGGRFRNEAIGLAAYGRNLVRAICGALLIVGWWLLVFAARPALTIPLLLSMGCLILTIGISVGGANTKYDLGFMPLLIIVAVSIVTEAARRISAVAQRLPYPAIMRQSGR